MGEAKELKCKTVIACVGTPLRGDDSIALSLAESLRRLTSCVVECPYGIELCAHTIRELKPKRLVVVDAAVGVDDVKVMRVEELAGAASEWLPTTHSIPARLLLRYLESLADELVFVLIPAKSTKLGSPPSEHAMRAASKAVAVIASLLEGD